MLARLNVVTREGLKSRACFSTLPLSQEFPHTAATPIKPAAATVRVAKADKNVTVVTKNNFAKSIHLNVVVHGGSSTESLAQQGAANFWGSNALIGNAHKSALQLVRQLEAVGTTVTASADREKIVIGATLLPDALTHTVDAILAALSAPPKHAHTIEEEKERTQMWYDRLHGCEQLQLHELIHEAAFGEESAFGKSQYARNLDALSTDSIVAYHRKHFVGGNVTILADGVESDVLVNALKGNSLPSGERVAAAPLQYVGGEVRRRTDDADAHVAVAFPVAAGANAKAFWLLQSQVVDALQRTDSKGKVQPFSFNYAAGGLAGFTVSGSAADVTHHVANIRKEFSNVAAGNFEIGALATRLTLENHSTLESSRFADAVLGGVSGDKVDLSRFDLRSVQKSAVADAAKAVLSATPSVAVLGNTYGVVKANKLWSA